MTMRFYLDTEFNEAPGILDLISIALVAEDGREFYAVSSEFREEDCNEWVRAHVLPKLAGERRVSRAEIRDGIRAFIGEAPPEMWGYFADYDWVLFCWLFGAMVDLPKGWPMFCLDLKQAMHEHGLTKDVLPAQPHNAHHALADARWLRKAHEVARRLLVSSAGRSAPPRTGGPFAEGEAGGDPREGPMHDWFGLSYSSYLVLPRVVIQSMPIAWQVQFVGLLDAARSACEAAGVALAESYYVKLIGADGRLAEEDLPHYRRAPLLGDPEWATAPRPQIDDEDPIEIARAEAAVAAFSEAIRIVEGLKSNPAATPEEMRQAALVALTRRSAIEPAGDDLEPQAGGRDLSLAEIRERYPEAWKAAEQLAADRVRRAAFNAALVEPPEVRAARDRYSEVSERFDAYDLADPPAEPPAELVTEYEEARKALVRAEAAAAGPPKIIVTPVPPLTTGTSVAFVDGPGLHGLAEVPTATFPRSERGAAMRELRQSIGASSGDVSRALRISVVEACGLERGSHTTDDAGWLEIQTALFLLGSREGASAIPIPPEVEAEAAEAAARCARGEHRRAGESMPGSCADCGIDWGDLDPTSGVPFQPPPEPGGEPALRDLDILRRAAIAAAAALGEEVPDGADAEAIAAALRRGTEPAVPREPSTYTVTSEAFRANTREVMAEATRRGGATVTDEQGRPRWRLYTGPPAEPDDEPAIGDLPPEAR